MFSYEETINLTCRKATKRYHETFSIEEPSKFFLEECIDRSFAGNIKPFLLSKFSLWIPRNILKQIKTWGILKFGDKFKMAEFVKMAEFYTVLAIN